MPFFFKKSSSFEEIGLFPRSFSRVFDRFFKQLFSDVENLVLQEYRFYRYLFLTTVKCIFILLFVPFIVNLLAKNYFVRPLSEYFWNKQTEIFLNAYQQKHAFAELQDFEETLYFKSLVLPNSIFFSSKEDELPENKGGSGSLHRIEDGKSMVAIKKNLLLPPKAEEALKKQFEVKNVSPYNPIFLNKGKEEKQTLQEKTVELAILYNNQSIEAITNFFADLISFIILCYLLVAMQIQINITKSFLLEIFFGLNDSLKSLSILLITDLLVGYHSDGPWAILFESLFHHYGLPENETSIFLLVATLPVILDVLFKYLIFRHLNRASPATVATFHAMIE